SSPPSAAEEGAPRAQGPLLLHHGKEARYARRAKRWEGEEDARKQRAPCGDGNSRPNASSPPTPGPLRGSSLLKGERESPSAPSKHRPGPSRSDDPTVAAPGGQCATGASPGLASRAAGRGRARHVRCWIGAYE